MKKAFVLGVIVVAFAAMSAATISWAADSGNVNATVTVQNISVGLTDTAVAYGTMAVDTIKTTTTTGDTLQAYNNGNVTEDLSAMGSVTSPASWTLAGTAAANTYVHEICTSSCDTDYTNYSAMSSGSYLDIDSSVVANATTTFDLLINTPTSVSDYTQQSMTVTILATAS
jgi:hypothetical protein